MEPLRPDNPPTHPPAPLRPQVPARTLPTDDKARQEAVAKLRAEQQADSQAEADRQRALEAARALRGANPAREARKTKPTDTAADMLLETVCKSPVPADQQAEFARVMQALERRAKELAAREAKVAELEAKLAQRQKQVAAEEQTLLTLRVEVTKRQADLVLREAELKSATSSKKSPSGSRVGGGLPAKIVIRDIDVPEKEGPRQPASTTANALFDDFAGPRSPAGPPQTEVYAGGSPIRDGEINEMSVLMADHIRLSKKQDDSNWENHELFAGRC